MTWLNLPNIGKGGVNFYLEFNCEGSCFISIVLNWFALIHCFGAFKKKLMSRGNIFVNLSSFLPDTFLHRMAVNICVFISLSLYLFMYPYILISPSIYLCVYLFVYLSIFISVFISCHLSICISVDIFLWREAYGYRFIFFSFPLINNSIHVGVIPEILVTL